MEILPASTQIMAELCTRSRTRARWSIWQSVVQQLGIKQLVDLLLIYLPHWGVAWRRACITSKSLRIPDKPRKWWRLWTARSRKLSLQAGLLPSSLLIGPNTRTCLGCRKKLICFRTRIRRKRNSGKCKKESKLIEKWCLKTLRLKINTNKTVGAKKPQKNIGKFKSVMILTWENKARNYNKIQSKNKNSSLDSDKKRQKNSSSASRDSKKSKPNLEFFMSSKSCEKKTKLNINLAQFILNLKARKKFMNRS